MVDVLVYKIITSYSGTWSGFTLTADNYIHVQIDPATFAIEVWYTSAEVQDAGTIYGQLFTGPNLYFGDDGVSTLTINNNWQACDGTALRKIGTNNLFPYATLSYQPGAVECAIVPVCDLNILVDFITDASGPAETDGSFVITGTSSNGTIKYSLDSDFDYATEGQLSGIFSGLLPGTYTVYAKDSAGCTDFVDVVIPITQEYGVRLRLTFQDHNKDLQNHRVDVLERAYEGEIEDFCSDAEVAKVKYKYEDTNDPDISVVPSYLQLALMVETEGAYSYLYGSDSDDRKFKIAYYVNDELYWTGFVVVEFYNGPYLHVPYPIYIKAVDGLEELTQTFADASGNQFKEPITMIKAIAEILKNTDLNLPIRNGIEVWDTAMDDTEDLLKQNYFDPFVVEGKQGGEVLAELPKPFRARVYQSQGKWWITQNSKVNQFHYTEYDKDGEETSDDDFDPTVDLKVDRQTNSMKWIERSQHQAFIRNYGYIAVNHILGKDGNLIDTGRFEEQDIVELGSGNFGFKDWNITIGQAGVKYGFEKLLNSSGPNGSSKGCAFFDFETVVSDQGAYTAQNWTKIYSKKIPFTRNGMMKVKFDYKAIPRYNVPWVRLGWSVQTNPGPTAIGMGFIPFWFTPKFPPFFSFEQTDPIINEIAIEQFNSWQHFELIGRTGYGGVDDEGYIEVTFYMHNHYGRDFDDITALKAYDLEGEPFAPGQVGKKIYVGEGGDTYVYTSEISTEAESLPNVVRPTTYGAGQVLWRLDKIITIGPGTGLVHKFNLDNVGIEFYYFEPTNSVVTDPPEELFYDQEVSTFVKSELIKPVLFGDMIRFNEEFELNEREVYDGWFRLEDGTPTTLWHRSGIDEDKKLLTMLKDDLVSQFSSSRERLTGKLIGDIPLHYVNVIRNVPGDNARYHHTDFEVDIKRLQYSVNLIEVVAGDDGEPLDIGEFSDTEFSDDYAN